MKNIAMEWSAQASALDFYWVRGSVRNSIAISSHLFFLPTHRDAILILLVFV
jgi:hypothetical protein